MIGPIKRARQHPDAIAIIGGGISHRYGEIVESAEDIAHILLSGSADLAEARVSFMVVPGFDYVSTLWGIWQAGGIAVPMGISSPPASIQYIIEHSGSSILVVGAEFESLLPGLAQEKSIRVVKLSSPRTHSKGRLPEISSSRRALILYTSGTTSLPKGAVTTHGNVFSQIDTLVNAWKWTVDDRTLCVLPLHHVHGLINVVCCSLWVGATCVFISEFDAARVFESFKTHHINVFMSVPTVYYKLIRYWESLGDEQEEISGILKSFRLMVSGSAALPKTVMEQWKGISGHTLLERYGMTEIGMAISNPYEGERRTGFVGIPLPGVSIRIVDENYDDVKNVPGEIVVKGDSVFLEYWNRPEITKASFTEDGWFKTGDIAVVENGYYRILGRSTTDIIKSGGYKISALEIEEKLRMHPFVNDCAVVGLDDEEWGEVVAAAIVPIQDQVDVRLISEWLKEQLPSYRVPRKFLVIRELPRNALGKIMKGELKNLF